MTSRVSVITEGTVSILNHFLRALTHQGSTLLRVNQTVSAFPLGDKARHQSLEV